MKKLKAFLIAVCLVLAILIYNAPDINYGLGPGVNPPGYSSGYDYEYSNDEASGSDS